MAVNDYSTTPASNTSISGINIDEGCSPAGINNAIRQLMADIKTLTGAYSTSGITSTVAELNYSDGVTSNIQTQLNTKAPISSPTFATTLDVEGTNPFATIKDTNSPISGPITAYMRFSGSDGENGSVGHLGSQNMYLRSLGNNTIIDAGRTAAGKQVQINTNNVLRFSVSDTLVSTTVPITATGLSVDSTAASLDLTDTNSPISGVVSSQVRFYGSDGLAGAIGQITSTDFYMRSENKSIILDADFTNSTGSSNITMRTDNTSRLRVDSNNVTAYVPFSGDGSGLTALNATQLTTGAVPSARLTSVPAASLTGTVDIARLPVASQAEAEAGTSSSKSMTPLRTKQAITSLCSTHAGVGSILFAYYNSTGASAPPGASVAGSDLKAASMGPSGGDAYISITAESGTWRSMGYALDGKFSVFQRIA